MAAQARDQPLHDGQPEARVPLAPHPAQRFEKRDHHVTRQTGAVVGHAQLGVETAVAVDVVGRAGGHSGTGWQGFGGVFPQVQQQLPQAVAIGASKR